MKKLFSIFAVALIFLALNCVPKYENRIKAVCGNLWTASQMNLGEFTVGSQPSGEFCEVDRWHFGFPLRAFYYDRGQTIAFGPGAKVGIPVWYAKLDSVRAIANTFIFLVVAFVFVMTATFIKRIQLKSLNPIQ